MVTSLTTPTSSLLSTMSSSDIVLDIEPSVVENSSVLSRTMLSAPLLSAAAASDTQSLLAQGATDSNSHSFVPPSPSSAFCGQSLASSCGANSMGSSGGVCGSDHRVNHVENSGDHRINHSVDHHGVEQTRDHHGVDHVDGHTLSTLPLTNVGCPDSALLTNLFQVKSEMMLKNRFLKLYFSYSQEVRDTHLSA